jgi:hypothetical protein
MLMRWAILMVVIAVQLCTPFAHGAAPSVARESELFTVVAPSEVVVHPNQTVSTYITVHNKASENQALTINALDVPFPLEVVGLPLTELLVPNHLRQMVFGIKANASSTYQNLSVSFLVTSDLNAEFNHTVNMNVMISPWSALNFGVEGVSQLTVDEKVRTAIAVNISNNASFADNVTFGLYSASTWEWGWDMPNTAGDSAYSVINPGQLIYVYFWVQTPAIENGQPLRDTGPRFILSATSGLDKQTTQWNVDLLMNEKKNASIDEVQSELVVAPNEDGRLDVVVRNVGNSANTLNITLQALDEGGVPMANTQASDRFSTDGWVVALFGGLEEVPLEPNQSRTIEVGFQAPNEFSGELNVRILVFASGGAALLKTADVKARIVRTTGAELAFAEQGCSEILPNQTCSATLSVTNIGNSYNHFLLRVGEISDGFEVTLPSEVLLVQANQVKSFEELTVRAEEQAVAFVLGTAIIEVLGDSNEVLAQVTIPLKVGPQIIWTFRNVDERVNARGLMTIAMEARNDGNAVDGLIVQLQSSHMVEMGFYPPDDAVYEEGIEYPRSFELNEIPLNSNFTIRAWIQLPQDQVNNGTVYINTTIRSRFVPELPFVYTSTGDYLGKQWQPAVEEEERIDWSALANTAVLYLKAWSGVLFSIALAGAVLYKAVVDRERRLERNESMPYQEQASADEWLKQYQKEPEPETVRVPLEPLQPVPKETYEAMFRHEHGQPSVPQTPVDSSLVGAANLVLERRTEDISKSKADDLLASIQAKGSSAVKSQVDLDVKQPMDLPNEPTVRGGSSRTVPPDDLEF